MLSSPLALLIPFALGLAIPTGLRFALGAERAPRFVGLGLALAFLIGWGVIVRPGWFAYDSVGRIGHIVLGGMLLGLALDLFIQRRGLVLAAAAIYLTVCAWAEVVGGVWPRQMPSAMAFVVFAVSAAIGIGVLWRIDTLRRSEQPHISSATAALILLMITALSLAVVASSGDLRSTAEVLAMAIGGCLAFSALFVMEIPATILLVATGGLFATGWAIIEKTPVSAVGIGISGLILFADGTARSISLPKAGISRILYPLILMGLALIPLGIAALTRQFLYPA